jgi:hypothetical protein
MSYGVIWFNPYTKSMLKATGAMLVLGSCVLPLLRIAGTISSEQAVAAELFLVVACLVLVIVFLVQDRGKRVVLTPTELTVERGSSQQRYPWKDVRSVSVETWRQGSITDRVFVSILLGKDADLPHVKVALRRSIRLPLWGSVSGTRVRGVFVPGVNILRLYLEEPQRFAEDTQHFLKHQ